MSRKIWLGMIHDEANKRFGAVPLRSEEEVESFKLWISEKFHPGGKWAELQGAPVYLRSADLPDVDFDMQDVIVVLIETEILENPDVSNATILDILSKVQSFDLIPLLDEDGSEPIDPTDRFISPPDGDDMFIDGTDFSKN